MLRRRILASAMASVMAIGSVAVVASADETAASTTYAKTKADLEAYVKSFDKFREDAIYDYGATAGEDFIRVIEFCDNVLADPASTQVEYSVAYMMLKGVYDSLKTYSSAELKELIANFQKTYDTDNMLNDETTDEIYDPDTFIAFKTAFEDAENVLGSSDSRLITDAYNSLKSAYNNLKAYTQVTKRDFRAALKSYESIIDKQYQYDSWRRGSLGGWIDDGVTKNFGDIQKVVADGVTSFGAITKVVFGDGKLPSGTVVFEIDNEATVSDFINAQYKIFDERKTVDKSTNPDIVKAYTMAKDAVAIFNGFTADDTNRANKASVSKLLDSYHIDLVTDYNTTGADKVYTYITGNTTPADWNFTLDARYNGVEAKEEEGYFKIAKGNYAKGTDVRKFVTVPYTLIDNNDDLQLAVKAAQLYILGEYDDKVYGLDEAGTISEGKGSAAEWTLVYRALKYALEDEYKSDYVAHTRADVVALIEKSYDLADKTGDAAVFSLYHNALVEARQGALAWVRDANKNKQYKDGVNKYNYAAVTVNWPYEEYSVGAVKECDASAVYDNLKKRYDELENLYLSMEYSFGQIFDTLGEVAAKIDDGKLLPSEALITAMQKTATQLATLKNSECKNWRPTELHADNDVFTSTSEFNAFNRLHTSHGNYNYPSPNNSEKALLESYNALLAEVKAQEEPAVVLGDVDGNGVVNALDASAILKAVVNNTAIDTKVGDYNSDGAVNALDAAAILKFVVSQ